MARWAFIATFLINSLTLALLGYVRYTHVYPLTMVQRAMIVAVVQAKFDGDDGMQYAQAYDDVSFNTHLLYNFFGLNARDLYNFPKNQDRVPSGHV